MVSSSSFHWSCRVQASARSITRWPTSRVASDGRGFRRSGVSFDRLPCLQWPPLRTMSLALISSFEPELPTKLCPFRSMLLLQKAEILAEDTDFCSAATSSGHQELRVCEICQIVPICRCDFIWPKNKQSILSLFGAKLCQHKVYRIHDKVSNSKYQCDV